MDPHSPSAVAHDAGYLRREAGLWLKALRKNAGLSQRSLAQAVGFPYYTTIAQIEVGKLRLQPDRYEAYAQTLNVDTQDFIKQLMSYYDPVTHRALFGKSKPSE
jgi:transcriptional regulator with XRE-family HTH domain